MADKNDERRKAQIGALLRHFRAARDGDFDHPSEDRFLYGAFSSDPEHHPPAVRELARRLVFRMDRELLSKFAGYDLSDAAVAEFATATALYHLRFDLEHNGAQYANPGFLSPDEWNEFLDNPRGMEAGVRRALVREVLAVWQKARPLSPEQIDENLEPATPPPSRASQNFEGETFQVPDHPVVKLVVALLKNLPQADHAEAFTIHHDLNHILRGTDRHQPTKARREPAP
ncbi:hypothetical protein SAMN02983003_1342 [Devosia enhydra]|uniref:Uncharacterized protein n=1 Tax=Devosia enhydra TaxID=665118 RepID=A0A1K2HWA8_9HYPH|nr:hypothetical protein [Devosia enhydra]SFZ82906.1 hypothetical protein SAMN02983003_1342 [Devosia enhydra]